ncbi:MAG: Holliday junction DNA helicase RuvA, partial [Thermodesulfobacteriota bacterium]|nr:Holliday junction DNA helicase RuvA [Thermodesulfobacteriota bacterium]
KGDTGTAPVYVDFKNQVLRVLVDQLGHKTSDANQMIAQALNRNKSVATPEELFEEVYRGETSK